jgi:hypothetical protein
MFMRTISKGNHGMMRLSRQPARRPMRSPFRSGYNAMLERENSFEGCDRSTWDSSTASTYTITSSTLPRPT